MDNLSIKQKTDTDKETIKETDRKMENGGTRENFEIYRYRLGKCFFCNFKRKRPTALRTKGIIETTL